LRVLLDSSALIGLLLANHVHHQRIVNYLSLVAPELGVCSLAEGAFLRTVLRTGGLFADGQAVLRELRSAPRYFFVPDDCSYVDVPARGVRGHRQVTDAYFVHLAQANGLQLITLDSGLASFHPNVATLVGDMDSL
jgi:hypothetical protein